MSGPDFFVMLGRFDERMEAEGLDVKTRAQYLNAVCRAGVRRKKDPRFFDSNDVAAVLASYAGQGPSRGQTLKALRRFYSWAEGRELLVNPAKDFKLKRRARPGPVRYKRLEEIRALLRAAFRTEPRRGWAIMLALATGGRARSLCAVRPEDVDLEAAELHFLEAKGGHAYSVPLGREGMVAVVHLLEISDRSKSPTLLGVGYGSFWGWVTEAAEFAGIEATPHTLRRTFGTFAARRSDPETFRQLMNHADLSQWPRYVGADQPRLREAVARTIR